MLSVLEVTELGPGHPDRALPGRVRPVWQEPGAICISHQNLCHCSYLDPSPERWGSKGAYHLLMVPQGGLQGQ